MEFAVPTIKMSACDDLRWKLPHIDGSHTKCEGGLCHDIFDIKAISEFQTKD